MTDAKQTKATKAGQPILPFLLPGNAEVMKSFAETPFKLAANLYREALGSTSRLLENQSNHFKNLAECTTPGDVLVCQSELVEKSIAAWSDDGRRIMETFSRTLQRPQ